jgi:hypothetical protein
MEVTIIPEVVVAIGVINAADVPSILGGKPLLVDTSSQYLLLKYKDQAGRRRQLILDFHGQQQSVDELIGLVI